MEALIRSGAIIFWASLMALALVAAYLAASVYFCSATLRGELGGCAVMSGQSLLHSPFALVATGGAMLGFATRLFKR